MNHKRLRNYDGVTFFEYQQHMGMILHTISFLLLVYKTPHLLDLMNLKIEWVHKKHLLVDEQKLGQVDFRNTVLKQGRHSGTYLADLVIRACQLSPKELLPLQLRALTRFRTDAVSYNLKEPGALAGRGGSAPREIPSDVIVRRYYHLFDEVFFFGSLRAYCQVNIILETADVFRRNGPCAGRILKDVKGIVPFFRKQHRHITIYRQTRYEKEERLVSYLGVLLHEMIHVFLALYCCNNHGCINTWRYVGDTGHAQAWQDIAIALEQAVQSANWFNLEVYLSRGESLAFELRAAGRALPGPGDLERWAITEDEIAGDMAEESRLERRHVTGMPVYNQRPRT